MNNLTHRQKKLLLLIAFFISGAAALTYEVIWLRQLTLIFGNTLYATSTVLTVFMAGLALGSLFFGHVVDKIKNPLRLYAYLEGGIGIYALCLPFIFQALSTTQLYFIHTWSLDASWFSLVRFGLIFFTLLIPTTLIGGTFPLIVKWCARIPGELGHEVGKLYALNTLGGMTGAFLVGYISILLLGVQGTLYVAVAGNLLIAIITFFLSRKPTQYAEAEFSDKAPVHSDHSPLVWATLLSFSMAGFAALSLEVSWTRALSMVLGNSTYAFSSVLTFFLGGIALGSYVVARYIDRLKDPVFWFFVVTSVLGLFVLLATPLFSFLPFIFIHVFSLSNGSFWPLQFMEFFIIGIVLLIPTLLMGAAFPLVSKICAQDHTKMGRSIGIVYFANTIGAILGPLATGFIFIPLFGVETSIFISAFLYIVIAVLILHFVHFKRPIIKTYIRGGFAFAVLVSCLLPGWNKNILNSGVYMYAPLYLHEGLSKEMPNRDLLFYKEGIVSTVGVKKNIANSVLTLTIDGKADASTGDDMGTQLILGHLPLLLHPDPKDVLVVGLGSGVTLGAVEQYSGVKSIDLVEIEPTVVEANSYFSQYNHNALADSRLNIDINDARNMLLTHDKKYDVITAEPSNPWVSGSANLFTKEQFELYKDSLKPGGIMMQWAHVYKLRPEEVATIIATFQLVFPHTVLWQSESAEDIFLIGTEEPLMIDFKKWEADIAQNKIKQDLSQVGLDDPYLLLSYFAFNEEGVRNFSDGATIHTDNRPVLEFLAPRSIFLDGFLTDRINLENMEAYRTDIFHILKNIDLEAERQKIVAYVQARTKVMEGDIHLFIDGGISDKVIVSYTQSVSSVSNVRVEKKLAGFYFVKAGAYLAQRNFTEAEEAYKKAIKWNPNEWVYYKALINFYLELKDYNSAIKTYEEAKSIFPEELNLRLELGVLYGVTGQLKDAEREFLFILDQDKYNYRAYNNLANIYHIQGNDVAAIGAYTASLSIEPDQQKVHTMLEELRGEAIIE